MQIFDEIGMDKLLDKQYLLTGYLEYLLDQLSAKVELITPRDPDQRGSQLSIIFPFDVKDIHDRLEKRGVVVCIFLSFLYTFRFILRYNRLSCSIKERIAKR